MSCPDDDTILRFVQGNVSDDERGPIELHLDGCDECRSAVAEAARAVMEVLEVEPPSPQESPLAVGTHVSRYEILGIAGMGGGGVVYRARDPELERSVALKLIRPQPLGTEGSHQAQTRLLREAQAMASLAHPNVVRVFDVGTWQGRVVLVMELIEGQTLGQWLKERPRPWQEVLDIFVAAGRGLAAAHRVGLVHRDFKPENVLVGSDGLVRVTDFGLARRLDQPAAHDPGVVAEASPEGSSEASSEASTLAASSLAGTPAYMAPEQFLGESIMASTDQFGFCVALYLALYGQHPFTVEATKPSTSSETRVEGVPALARDVIAGNVRPAPPGSEVPPGIREVVLRGLNAAPRLRYPSMEDLLAEIDRLRAPQPTRASPRSRAVRAALPVAGAALGLASLWFLLSGGVREKPVGVASVCGDGIVGAPEECDDKNRSDQDGCLSNCRFAKCGDGLVRARVEECDDGNRVDGDDCSTRCQRCRAGDAAFVFGQGGHCYSRHDRPMAWSEARDVCAEADGDLATLTTSLEISAVYDRLLQGGARAFWIGLHDAEGTGQFTWVTGESTGTGKLPGPFTNREQKTNRCARIVPGKFDKAQYLPAYFEAAVCTDVAPAVCERSEWFVNPRDNHAYLTVSRELPWEQARADCVARGAHLATITSPEEQTFIALKTSQPVWIGITDSAQEGDFRWVTAETSAYRGFVAGEPDGRDWSDCVLFGLDDGWHDRRCSDPYLYLCEID